MFRRPGPIGQQLLNRRCSGEIEHLLAQAIEAPGERGGGEDQPLIAIERAPGRQARSPRRGGIEAWPSIAWSRADAPLWLLAAPQSVELNLDPLEWRVQPGSQDSDHDHDRDHRRPEIAPSDGAQ